MPKLKYRKIYDDEGDEMMEGDEVLVNNEHERIIFFDDQGEISLENWNWEENMVFSIRKKQRPDDRYEDIDEPTLDDPRLPSTSQSQNGRRTDIV